MTPGDEPSAETRILIADDHDSFRSGLRAVLGTADGLLVVGEAASGSQAVSQVAALHPDVVLMDLTMPGMDGIEATRRIVDAAPHVAVLVLTMSDDDDSVFAAIQAGARGYLLKGAQRAELIRSVRAVAAGDAIFGPAVARRLMAYFSRPKPSGAESAFPELTDREREILELVAQGRSNADITAHLVLSPKTVRNHVSNIFSKLQVRDRAEAIVRAREAGHGRRDAGCRLSRDTKWDGGPVTTGHVYEQAARKRSVGGQSMARSVARTAYPVVAGLFVACAIIQVFLAGLGVFDDPSSFITHRNFGYMFGWLTLVLLVIALVGRMQRRFVGLAVLLLVLFSLQSVFVAVREDMPAVAALHPLNGFLILAVAGIATWSSWKARAEAQAPQPGAMASAAPSPVDA